MDDLISRQAAIDRIADIFEDWKALDIEEVTYALQAVSERLQNLPTIDPVRHGRWEEHPYCQAWDVCSICGTGVKRRAYGINPDGSPWVSEKSYSYCPWCGAKIDGGEE